MWPSEGQIGSIGKRKAENIMAKEICMDFKANLIEIFEMFKEKS